MLGFCDGEAMIMTLKKSMYEYLGICQYLCIGSALYTCIYVVGEWISFAVINITEQVIEATEI